MIGDKLVITEYHKENGAKVAAEAIKLLPTPRNALTITVAGESGSGKSETAATTAMELERLGHKVIILGQDDYFRLPPKSNSEKRHLDIDWVGTGEVRLDLMDEHLRAARNGDDQITKPLVYFEKDRVGEEVVSLAGIDVVIAEGTYTTALEEVDLRAFIDATYHHTLEHRKKRARDEAEGAFIEQVLEIEHEIISAHKARADVILPPSP
jgi:uridine kinase